MDLCSSVLLLHVSACMDEGGLEGELFPSGNFFFFDVRNEKAVNHFYSSITKHCFSNWRPQFGEN